MPMNNKPEAGLPKLIKFGLFFLAAVLAAYFLWPEQKDFAGEDQAIGAMPEEQDFRTVRAETRTITSVLVLDANVVANPQFRITAPADGILVELGKNRFGVIPAAKNSADPDRSVLARDGLLKDDLSLDKKMPKSFIEPIRLPQNSTLEHLLVLPGAKVSTGLPIFNARYTGFALQAIVPPEKLHRLFEGIISARAEITNGPGPFDSPILGTPFVPGTGGYILDPGDEEGNEGNEEDNNEEDDNEEDDNEEDNAGYLLFGGAIRVTDFTQGVAVIAAAPANLRLLEGAPGLLALTTAKATNAVVLPIEAVAGISQRGQVYLYQDGQRLLREVTLGITDGSYVEITSGLSAGDQVIVPSPGIANLR